MMSNINIIVDEETRKEATEIFTKLGFDMNTVVNLLLRSIILEKGIPFDLNKLSRLDSLEAKNDFSYIPVLEDNKILVTVNTSIESRRAGKEFRRLDIEIDVLLELVNFSSNDDEKEIIDKVHEQYELLNKIIIENIMNSMTSLDDLPKLWYEKSVSRNVADFLFLQFLFVYGAS